MNRLDRAKEPWILILGKDSHVNLLGKIVLFPFIFVVAGVFSLCELLFSKDK